MTTWTLAEAPLRTPLTLIDTAREPSVRRRLYALGLRPGSGIEVVSRAVGGGRVVAVAGARVALALDLASGLTVSRA